MDIDLTTLLAYIIAHKKKNVYIYCAVAYMLQVVRLARLVCRLRVR